MRIRYEPSGGRYGWGFDYYCSECNEYLGNTVTHLDQSITHSEFKTELVNKGIFSFLKPIETIKTRVTCSQAGQNFLMQLPFIELNSFKVREEDVYIAAGKSAADNLIKTFGKAKEGK